MRSSLEYLGYLRKSVAALAVVTVALLAVFAGSGSAARTVIYPTLYVNYTMGCTFSIVNDAGSPVTTIAPGYYEVDVITPTLFRTIDVTGLSANDYTACKGWVQFQLTGPGVTLFTTLDTGCENNETLSATYFAPSSTFTAEDLNNPGGTLTTFRTAATGTPVAPTGYAGEPTTTGKDESSGGIVGSNVPESQRLAATVSANGNATLSLASGKSAHVQQVTTGSYLVMTVNQDAHSGLVLQQNGFPAISLTDGEHTGRTAVTVTLTSGIWKYYSTAKPKVVHTFIVTTAAGQPVISP